MSIDTSKLSFEEALEKLEEIVNQLQDGDIKLEESMEAFQDGIALSKYCSQTLENAEETMTKLMSESGQLEAFEEPTSQGDV
ncbi:exodeoxyribonuclease VII small subunit [Aerococcus urinaeequi]|uniref:Exodeoxyribonuclease 7 small subunit n=1 Tax=Aerococcus viridans TaxID=1377 RepID=A0A2N6UEL1_9LACT|nr:MULTISPECIES: exodeoxyribonuclease VII small subunit [Aerococcus]OFU48804.1 exodeoxyribonuclease VII small subunit [Aerococcus sp. HMSC10H05]PMC79987.1 exodeoxyribonuclease VII small subunit [Aerococcus viridans]